MKKLSVSEQERVQKLWDSLVKNSDPPPETLPKKVDRLSKKVEILTERLENLEKLLLDELQDK